MKDSSYEMGFPAAGLVHTRRGRHNTWRVHGSLRERQKELVECPLRLYKCVSERRVPGSAVVFRRRSALGLRARHSDVLPESMWPRMPMLRVKMPSLASAMALGLRGAPPADPAVAAARDRLH